MEEVILKGHGGKRGAEACAAQLCWPPSPAAPPPQGAGQREGITSTHWLRSGSLGSGLGTEWLSAWSWCGARNLLPLVDAGEKEVPCPPQQCDGCAHTTSQVRRDRAGRGNAASVAVVTIPIPTSPSLSPHPCPFVPHLCLPHPHPLPRLCPHPCVPVPTSPSPRPRPCSCQKAPLALRHHDSFWDWRTQVVLSTGFTVVQALFAFFPFCIFTFYDNWYP